MTFCVRAVVDFSKNRITEKTVWGIICTVPLWCVMTVNLVQLELLIALAERAGVQKHAQAMFSGAHINGSEDRAVLHSALRRLDDKPLMVDGCDVLPGVHEQLALMRSFAEKVRSGSARGFTDSPFTDVVSIGIGGSDLGPVMVTQALTVSVEADMAMRSELMLLP